MNLCDDETQIRMFDKRLRQRRRSKEEKKTETQINDRTHFLFNEGTIFFRSIHFGCEDVILPLPVISDNKKHDINFPLPQFHCDRLSS